MGVEASIEIQNAARAVVRENTRLKELLRKVGMRNDEIEKWIAEGGLETGAVDRVQCGLGRRPCPSLEGGIAKTGSRAEILGRRSSTGGMLMKVLLLLSYFPHRCVQCRGEELTRYVRSTTHHLLCPEEHPLCLIVLYLRCSLLVQLCQRTHHH